MDIIRFGRNVTIIALLLSLLFHTSSIFYVFVQKKQPSPLENPLQHLHEKEALKQKNQWVQTEARQGNFGAPVFFQDEPKEVQQENREIAQNHAEETHANETISAENNAPVEEQKTKAIASSGNILNTMIDHNAPPMFIKEEKPEIRNAPKRTPRKKQPNYATKKRPAPMNMPAQHKKKPISLADLAQGFLHRSKNEGDYSVSMLGLKGGMPSDEQLKYERYLQKLEWCFQNSLRINGHRIPRLTESYTVHIHLALNRDGTVKHLGLAQSSKNIMLDQFVLFVFKDASSSYPPVPEYIKDNPFAITCIVPFYIN